MSNEKASHKTNRSCQECIQSLTAHLKAQGLQVEHSFDLQSARRAHPECGCPHHGQDACNCQMVVLLVYGEGERPVSIVIHGDNQGTDFILEKTPGTVTNSHLESLILKIIVNETLQTL